MCGMPRNRTCVAHGEHLVSVGSSCHREPRCLGHRRCSVGVPVILVLCFPFCPLELALGLLGLSLTLVLLLNDWVTSARMANLWEPRCPPLWNGPSRDAVRIKGAACEEGRLTERQPSPAVGPLGAVGGPGLHHESCAADSGQTGAATAVLFPVRSGRTAGRLATRGLCRLSSKHRWVDRQTDGPGCKANPSDSNLFLNRLLPHLKRGVRQPMARSSPRLGPPPGSRRPAGRPPFWRTRPGPTGEPRRVPHGEGSRPGAAVPGDAGAAPSEMRAQPTHPPSAPEPPSCGRCRGTIRIRIRSQQVTCHSFTAQTGPRRGWAPA